jgi:hypothetical protein
VAERVGQFVYEMGTEARTVDERPHKESNDVCDGKGNLGEIKAERTDGEGRSEGQHPVGVHDHEGKTSDRGTMADCPTIRLGVRRFPLAGE